MNVLKELERAGGCEGGRLVYFLAKPLVEVANLGRKHITLWPDTKKIMRRFFPKLDLDQVSFQNNCELPGNWFTPAKNVAAMTFGNRIFFKGKDIQKSWAKLELLMHELVHVDQVRRYGGEWNFACAYGKGFLAAGNYRDNKLEKEAFDLVAKNPLPASLPASLRKLPRQP